MADALDHLMPRVIAFPLAGLATELGGLTDRINDMEARRLGATVVTAASASIPAGTSTGVGPAADVSIAAGGTAIVFAGLLMPATAGLAVQMALTINGTEIVTTSVVDSSASVPVPVTLYWAQGGLPLGANTFTLDVDNVLNPFTATSLFVAVIPV